MNEIYTINELIERRNNALRMISATEALIENQTVEYIENLITKYIILKIDKTRAIRVFESGNRGLLTKLPKKKTTNETYYYLGFFDYKQWLDYDGELEDFLIFDSDLVFALYEPDEEYGYGMYIASYTKNTKGNLYENEPIFKLNYLEYNLTESENILTFDTEEEAKLFMEVVE